MSKGEIYLTAAELSHRVGELGAEISADFQGRDLLLVVPLKGCVVFATDLSRATRRTVSASALGSPAVRTTTLKSGPLNACCSYVM